MRQFRQLPIHTKHLPETQINADIQIGLRYAKWRPCRRTPSRKFCTSVIHSTSKHLAQPNYQTNSGSVERIKFIILQDWVQKLCVRFGVLTSLNVEITVFVRRVASIRHHYSGKSSLSLAANHYSNNDQYTRPIWHLRQMLHRCNQSSNYKISGHRWSFICISQPQAEITLIKTYFLVTVLTETKPTAFFHVGLKTKLNS